MTTNTTTDPKKELVTTPRPTAQVGVVRLTADPPPTNVAKRETDRARPASTSGGERASVPIPRPEDRPTLQLWPQVGHILGLGRAATYDAARRGDIPIIRFGRRLVVPTAALRRMLAIDTANS
jgi:hypothetical protein